MGTKNIQNIIVQLVLCASLVTACVKDKPAEPVNTQPPPTASGNVFVVCEGNFGNGDGSLYLYNKGTGEVSGDVYAAANSNNKLGDVFQSMTRIGDRLFLCVNNSDKVLVLNSADRKLVGSISIPKPRYILPVDESKAYVSTMYSNKVYVVNPSTLQVINTIDIPFKNPEGMVMYNHKVYVCPWDTACTNIYSINTAADKLDKTIVINAAAPQEALVDKQNRLWVLSGNVPKGKPAKWTVLNDKEEIVTSYDFPAKADAVKPVLNSTKDVLYFIEVDYNGGKDNNGIYRMNIGDAALPATAFVPAQSFQYFWALGIDPATDKIYIGDPKGFIQKGSVLVYNPDGSMFTSFDVGLGPGHFFFD